MATSPYPTMPATNQLTRGLPYLHRNWLSAINYLQEMGSNHSTPSHDDEEHRPVKRQRVDENAADPPPGLSESLLPGGGESEKALQIEVLKIAHKDSARVRANALLNGLVPPQVRDVSDSKARCRISISYEKTGVWVPVHVDSQICTMKTYKNPVGPGCMVRVHLPQPFQVAQDKLVVPREDDDVLFGLAKSYSVQIELESVGDPKWPPSFLTATDSGSQLFDRVLPQREWVLSAAVKDIYHCNRNRNLEVRLAKHPVDTISTSYVMDVDVRWSTTYSATGMLKRMGKDVRPSITVHSTHNGVREADIDDVGDLANGMNGTNGVNGVDGVNGISVHAINEHDVDMANDFIHGEAPDELEDHEQEGELTPGRARRRARQKVNYNLKILSDQAAGRERRKRSTKLGAKYGHELGIDPQGQSRIAYFLPAEELQIDDFGCFLCGASHQSLSYLRAHLLGHTRYEFDFDMRSKGGFHVSVVNSYDHSSASVRREIFQLGLPLKPFDIEEYLAGDDSWVTSRFGPENDNEVESGHDEGARRKRRAPPQKLLSKKRTERVVVPRTKRPLFDPLSKVQLRPGTLLEPHVPDESWLIQKHRDTLGDYTDVGQYEKEYMKMWDAFILPLHLTSEQYLPRSFLAFVKEKANWLVAVPSRAQEFSKHMQVLYARNAINEGVIETALEYLDQARAQPAEGAPSSPVGVRSRGGCAVCGKTVTYGPAFLACSHMNCKNRLYHDYCVKNPKVPVEKTDWRCNACS